MNDPLLLHTVPSHRPQFTITQIEIKLDTVQNLLIHVCSNVLHPTVVFHHLSYFHIAYFNSANSFVLNVGLLFIVSSFYWLLW